MVLESIILPVLTMFRDSRAEYIRVLLSPPRDVGVRKTHNYVDI